MLFILFTRRHVLSVSTLHVYTLCIAHSGVPPQFSRAQAQAQTRAQAHTQVSTLPLVFVNIKPQNNYLNMTSACLC